MMIIIMITIRIIKDLGPEIGKWTKVQKDSTRRKEPSLAPKRKESRICAVHHSDSHSPSHTLVCILHTRHTHRALSSVHTAPSRLESLLMDTSGTQPPRPLLCSWLPQPGKFSWQTEMGISSGFHLQMLTSREAFLDRKV